MNATKQAEKQPSESFERIARDILQIDTLTTRQSDGLDFHDLAVWTIREALEAAYAVGFEAGKRTKR